MSEYRELLLGCGNSRVKRMSVTPLKSDWHDLTTLDVDPACDPEIVFDLCWIGEPVMMIQGSECERDTGEKFRIPRGDGLVWMPDNSFDEIHAYEVLEHCGAQGNFKLFFAQFREFWRVLKPGGYFCATVPDWRSVWAWGDPSHTRIINEGTLVFLSQKQYTAQVGKTAMSDFRSLLTPADFEICGARTRGEQFEFVLRAIK